MTRNELIAQIRAKASFLCVGLDTDIEKIPTHLLSEADPVFAFNRRIIDATLPYAVAYKPNTAFYEARGSEGWISLERTMEYLSSLRPKPFIIADAKRGDIGNTSSMYARAIFERLGADAVTLSPYMGQDTFTPFLKYQGKWAVVLALTSNPSSRDFQLLRTASDPDDGEEGAPACLFEQVIRTAAGWGGTHNIMYVVGATRATELGNIRKLGPDHFLLVPGVGSQGGSLEEVARYGLNADCGLLVNASRSIIFASSGPDFAEAAADEARLLQQEMQDLLRKEGIVATG